MDSQQESTPLYDNQRKNIENYIENKMSKSMSLSALSLSRSECNRNDLLDEVLLMEKQTFYAKLKAEIAATPMPQHKLVKPNLKSSTTSLFDMFSSSNHLLQSQLNIRDVLDSSESKLLEQCYRSNVVELILGFNTTDSEISQLASMLFRHIVMESSKQNCIVNASNSFLDLHLKWMEACKNEEECHPFVFMLIRNVLLGLQHAKSQSRKICMIQYILKMLTQLLKAYV